MKPNYHLSVLIVVSLLNDAPLFAADAVSSSPPANSPAASLTAKQEKPNPPEDKKSTGSKSEEKPRLFKPLVWGADNEFKLQFGGDTRIRAERRVNYDMDRNVGDNDDLGFIRTRLNWDLTYCEFTRAFVEILDGREVDTREFQGQQDHVDLHQAFVEFADKKRTPWGIRIGRQEMELGRDKRLSEASNWNNLRRRFDGVNVLYRSEDLDVNTFVMQPNYFERKQSDLILTDHGHRRTDEYFYGTYATLRHWKPHTIEAYFLGLSDRNNHRTFPKAVKSEDGRFGTTDRYTIGSAMYGPLWKRSECGTLSYGWEAAYQFGHRSTDEIRAHMLHGDLNYEWEHPWKPKLSLVGNLATGDIRTRDGNANAFSPIFGSSHSPYGIIDFTRLQNLRELALVGSANPTDKLKTQVELHGFWLDSKTDSWTDTRGNTLGKDSTGRSGRHIGNEIDAYAQYKLTKFVTLEAGAAHFFSGDFAQNVGRRSGASLFYVQTTITF